MYLVRLGPKTGASYNQAKSAPYEPCHWSKAHCTCFWPYKARVQSSLPTLLDFQLFFCRFFANQRPSIVPPYGPHTNADVRGDPHTPHPTPRHTRNTRIRLRTSTETRYNIRIPICTLTTDGCASAASEIEVGSIYPTLQELRAAAAKQATCLACCWCGVVWDAKIGGISPYVGIRVLVGSIGWNYGGSLIGSKTARKT